jgi:hypothetical protein
MRPNHPPTLAAPTPLPPLPPTTVDLSDADIEASAPDPSIDLSYTPMPPLGEDALAALPGGTPRPRYSSSPRGSAPDDDTRGLSPWVYGALAPEDLITPSQVYNAAPWRRRGLWLASAAVMVALSAWLVA